MARRIQWLKAGEVAALFNVTVKTVTRWTTEGKLSAVRSPGGHFLYNPTTIANILKERRHGSTTP